MDAIAQSKECEGYTGADLAALVREACVEAFKDFLLEVPKLSKPVVGRKHFMKALAKIRPSVPEKVSIAIFQFSTDMFIFYLFLDYSSALSYYFGNTQINED